MNRREQIRLGQLDEIDNDAILQSLSEGVCLIGSERRIIFANRSAAELLGYEDALELVGRHYDLVFFHRDKTLSKEEFEVCPIQFALSDGASTHAHAETFYRADGGALLVDYKCSPLFEAGAPVGAVVAFEDVTERRELEAIVEAAREAAFEAARAKAAFLANISHEIRTPLVGIVGMTDLLLDADPTAEQREYLETLQKSVDLLMATVNDILDLSKIEAGKLVLETVDFDLRELVEETIDLFKTAARNKHLALEFSIDAPARVSYRGDASRLRQVLNNLLSNAVKFTEAGEIRLGVSKTGAKDGRHILQFEVSDTGIGIDAAQLPHIFQPFAQAEISTSRRFGGTGLGLSICREIVEMMGGEIGVESEIGEGARFWLRVPMTPGAENKRARAGERAELQSLKSKKQNLSVLIAEDDEVNREIASKMLRQLGCRTDLAEDGAEAVKKASETSFDLIMMDCQMPKMNGFAAAETIRRLELERQPKIVALTAFSAREERDKCLAAGMDDYLQKPVTKNDLAKILYQHFPAENRAINLDLEANLGQHSLAEIITPEILQNLMAIESRGEKDFVFEILQIYCENTDEQLAGVRSDLQKRDAKAIARRAHSLKGSSANVGLAELTAAFGELQAAAVFEDWTRIVVLIAEIIEKFEFIKRKVFEKR